jgi:hypothetical protein
MSIAPFLKKVVLIQIVARFVQQMSSKGAGKQTAFVNIL